MDRQIAFFGPNFFASPRLAALSLPSEPPSRTPLPPAGVLPSNLPSFIVLRVDLLGRAA